MANRQPSDRIGRAGEHYVAAELNRRGAYAAPFSGNVRLCSKSASCSESLGSVPKVPRRPLP